MKNIDLHILTDFDKKCHQSIADFREMLLSGFFNYDDGHGYYATNDAVSNEEIDFDDILNYEIPNYATHICWYNK